MLVCAPGAAAYNMFGYTCHAAFLLPLLTKKNDDYNLLSSQSWLYWLSMIINDEISMVGADTLLVIHRRFRRPGQYRFTWRIVYYSCWRPYTVNSQKYDEQLADLLNRAHSR